MMRTGETYSTARAAVQSRARTAVAGSAIMIPVSDIARAVVFYRDALGFPVLSENPDGSWAELGDGATVLGLHAGRPGGADTGLGLLVDDLDAARATVIAHGGVARDGQDGHVLFVLDPDGNTIRLMRRAGP